jgi:hypothetical protein
MGGSPWKFICGFKAAIDLMFSTGKAFDFISLGLKII